MSFSYTPAYTRCGDLVASIGVNIHLRGSNGALYANVATVMASLAYLGVDLVRDSTYAPSNANAANYTAMAQAGFRFNMLANTNFTPAQMVSYLEPFETANAGSVHAQEGVNEINNYASYSYDGFSGTNANASGEVQMSDAAAAYEGDLLSAVRASPILTPKLVFNFTDYPDTAGACDAGAFHTYPPIDYSPGPGDRMGYNEYTQEQVVSGKPVVCTEFNWAYTGYAGDIDQATQAKYLLIGLLCLFWNGVSEAYIYELFDEQTSATKIQDPNFYGLFTSTGVEKQAATALRNLIQVLRDDDLGASEFTPSLPAITVAGGPTRIRSMALQKANGQIVLAVWNDVRLWANGAAVAVAASTVTITLPTAAQRLEIYDPVNSPDPIAYAFNASTLAVSLSDRPLLITVSAPPLSGGINLDLNNPALTAVL